MERATQVGAPERGATRDNTEVQKRSRRAGTDIRIVITPITQPREETFLALVDNWLAHSLAQQIAEDFEAARPGRATTQNTTITTTKGNWDDTKI